MSPKKDFFFAVVTNKLVKEEEKKRNRDLKNDSSTIILISDIQSNRVFTMTNDFAISQIDDRSQSNNNLILNCAIGTKQKQQRQK